MMYSFVSFDIKLEGVQSIEWIAVTDLLPLPSTYLYE